MTTYILKSSLSLIVLFGLYWFLLRQEKLFVFNRFFLLASVMFSLIAPFIVIPVNFHLTPQISEIISSVDYSIPKLSSAEYNAFTTDNIYSNLAYVENHQPSLDLSRILLGLYISGVLFFLTRFLKNIFVLVKRTRFSEKIDRKGHRIVLTDDRIGPCCFFSNIYLNRDDYLNGRIKRELLDHELEHVKQSHTIDIIIIELVKIFYWINPVYILYDRAIRINHEYLADNGVLKRDNDVQGYIEKLIGFLIGKSNIPLTSRSNNSFIRKRLLMITKRESESLSYGFRIFATLGVVMVFVLLLSFRESDRKISNDLQTQSVTDIDGNVYSTVTISGYVWMAENLKTTRYNDGTKIPLVTDNEHWQKYQQAFCWYNNDEKYNKGTFGALYNWYVISTGKLCPIGWHVPDWEELKSLTEWNPGDTLNGGKLKEAGTVRWREPNTAATNETKFTALPSGLRNYTGEFISQGKRTVWWTLKEYDEFIGYGFGLDYNDGRLYPHVGSKRIGYSVRCIKDYPKNTSFASDNPITTDQKIIRGIVMTEDGKPLFGATITGTRTDNTPIETIADFDGRFSLEDIKVGTSLLVEYRGFSSQTVLTNMSSELIVKLSRDPNFKDRVFIQEVKNANFRNPDFTPANAILVINDNIIDYNRNLKINPDEMKSFKVLNGKEATSKYGEKAKDGAVEIVLFGHNTKLANRKQFDNVNVDTSKYLTRLQINYTANEGEPIDIPVSNLQYVSVWTHYNLDKTDRKELRSLCIFTRDFYKVKGKVVRENGKPLPGVRISATDNPVIKISDKEGRFIIEDVRENTMLQFSLPGYKSYYLATGPVAYTMDMTIELEKDNVTEKEVLTTAEVMPQYPGGEMELRKFIATNLNYPEEARSQKAEGVVIVRFVVNTKGDIEDAQILQRVHPAVDIEVLRIIGKLDRFVPGSDAGRPVNVYYTIPITFNLP